MNLQVSNLSYYVRSEGRNQHLLKSINCFFPSGNLCAVMGPSGAGKSTLLDLLARRKEGGTWSGEILINNKPRSKNFKDEIAYVLQDDLHIPNLTVEETILFFVRTKSEKTISSDESAVKARVDYLIDLLELGDVRHSLVGGGIIKGISGGQSRRLSIAVALVVLPNLIFFDELTSGLDSVIALDLMRTVRKLIDPKKLCITTIHQPSKEIFELFDLLAILSSGNLIYFGEAKKAVEYFSQPSLRYRFGGDVVDNPAEFLIAISDSRVASYTEKGEENENRRSSRELSDIFENSDARRVNQELREKYLLQSAEPGEGGQVSRERISLVEQFVLLIQRSFKTVSRNTSVIYADLLQSFAAGILMGVAFYGLAWINYPIFHTTNDDGGGDWDDVVFNLPSLFYWNMEYTILKNISTIPQICSSIKIFRREHKAGAYSVLPFAVAESLINLPLLLLNLTVYLTILFFLGRFPLTADYYFFYLFDIYFVNVVTLYVAYAIAAAFDGNETVSVVLFPMVFMFNQAFGGYGLKLQFIPTYWNWAATASYFRWGFQGLQINEWNLFDLGNGVMDLYTMEMYPKGRTFWILTIFIAFYATLFLLGLLFHSVEWKIARNVVAIQEPVDQLSAENNHTGLQDDKIVKAEEVVDDYDSLPVSSIPVYFQDLQYSVVVQKNPSSLLELTGISTFSTATKTVLLNNVSGYATPGRLCALLGPSGAGKSTLLDVIAKRKTTGEVKGSILIGGLPHSSFDYKQSAYVLQDDSFIGVLTVRETLLFSADLRLPEEWSSEKKSHRVAHIIETVGLQNIADSIVGTDKTHGISGGEKKRLSIATEIIHLPSIIFLDEPTTGLDSSGSYEVMSAVKKLALQNRTIISTLHQPSQKIFQLLDDLILLSQGRVIYFGPAENAVTYFSSPPFRSGVDLQAVNPAEFILGAASEISSSSQSSSSKYSVVQQDEESAVVVSDTNTNLSVDAVTVYLNSGNYQYTLEQIQSNANDPQISPAASNNGSKYFTSLKNELSVLLRRSLLVAARDYNQAVYPFLRYVIIALFYGSVFYHLPKGSTGWAYNSRLSNLNKMMNVWLLSQATIIPQLFENQRFYYREKGSKLYGALAYFTSTVLVNTLINAVSVLVYEFIIYYMVGLHDTTKAQGIFYVTLLLIASVGFVLSLTCCALAPNCQTALNYFSPSLMFSTTYAGVNMFIPDFPRWEGSWAPYLSFMRYGIQSLALNELSGNTDFSAAGANSHFVSWGFTTLSSERCIGILIAFLIANMIAAYSFLEYFNFEKR